MGLFSWRDAIESEMRTMRMTNKGPQSLADLWCDGPSGNVIVFMLLIYHAE